MADQSMWDFRQRHKGERWSREATTHRNHAPVLQTKSSVAHLQAQEAKDGEQLRAEEER